MSAYEITGTYNGSAVLQGLQQLQNALNSIRAPTITPTIQTGGANSVLGGLKSQLLSGKGDFASVGQSLGQSLTMGMTSQMGMAGNVAGAFATSLGGVGVVALGAVAGVAALGAASVSAAQSWESMKTSIGRTTGLDGRNLEGLMNDLQDLRQEMGITAEAAAGLVEQAGSIGVGQAKMAAGDIAGYQKEITDFAKTTAILQGAWGMSAEATSSGIGKMGSVTLGSWNMQRKAADEAELSWSEYANTVGGKVDALANAMGSSEEEIVTAMKNSSAAVASYAPSEETYSKWLALSSFLIDTGSNAGEAGTQIERMAKGAKQHGADLGAILGMDEAGFSAALQTDFVGTFQNIATALAAMPESERPDMIKLLGIEGSGAMDKMIADVKTGVNKLNTAIKLDPTNVTEGWDKVADDAGTAFNRIAQAAQVSLEKIGGLLLPVVTDVANGIATGITAVNEYGSGVYDTVSANVANADKAINETGSIVEWGKALFGMGDAVAEEVSTGATAGAEAAAPGVAEGLTSDIAAKTAEEFAKGQEEYIKSMSSGGYSTSLLTGGEVTTNKGKKIMVGAFGSQYSTNYGDFGYKTTDLAGTNYASLANYDLQKTYRKSDVGGILKITDSSGSIIKSESYSSDSQLKDLSSRLKKAIEPSFTNSPKYLRSVGSDLSDELNNALSDGVLEFTEKDTLSSYVKQLDDLQVKFPLEFEATNLTEIRDQLFAAGQGIELKFKNPELETNFAIWQSERMDMYENIYKQTGVMSYESEQKSFQQKLLDSYDPDRVNTLVGYVEKAAAAGATTQDIEILPEIIDEIAAKEPQLLKEKAMTNMLLTAQEQYKDQVRISNGQFQVLDENGKVLSTTHLRTSQAADILSGGLTSTAAATDTVISSANSLAAALQNAATAAGNFSASKGISASSSRYSNISPASVNKSFGSSLDFAGIMNLPKLAEGGKVTAGGLAWIGEAGTEYVIPESSIKGLYPESAKVDEGSMEYLTGAKFFKDYPYSITAPKGYQYSKWPTAPQVNVSGEVPTAWLSDKQSTGMEAISSEIRAMQLEAIKTGGGSVMPYWLRGEQAQPEWWTKAATSLSPQYASNWAANKGGNMPQIVSDAQSSTISEDVALINDPRSDACIAFVKPSSSLRTTDAFYLANGAADIDTDRALLYDERTGSCIPMLSAPYLKTTDPFYLNSGSMNTKGETTLNKIEKNTAATEKEVSNLKTSILGKGIMDNGGIFGRINPATGLSSGTGALVTGLSEDGYVVTYDPRTDTCEGLAFNPPDPSLKTTDKFYLGITAGNLPNESYDEGYGWGGRVGWTDNEALQKEQSDALSALKKSSEKTEDSTKQTAENTGKMATDVGAIVNGGTTSGGLVIGGGGSSSGIIGLANNGSLGGWAGTPGSWGGTSVNGAGGWVGTGASYSGWGAQASSAASGGGSSSWGSVQWAEGGIVSRPTVGVFGEAGTEAFVPISDRAAGLRILPAVLRGLGVPAFAKGGIIGNISAAVGGINLGGVTVINNSRQAVNERKLAKEIGSQIEAKFYKDRKR